jgi:hypothetical protein
MNELTIWFKPWEYAHPSWTEQHLILNNTAYQMLASTHQNQAYHIWCKHVGIASEFRPYQSVWIEPYWLENQKMVFATHLLGNTLFKQKDYLVTPNYLRWIQQTNMARPIVLQDQNIRFKNNFEAGINLLYQIVNCYCPNIWTRFLLKFPKQHIEEIHIYEDPLVKGKTILIIEKLWRMIIKKMDKLD